VSERNIHPHKLGSGGYTSATKQWKDGEIISSSSSSSSSISSVSDPRGYRWMRARAVPDEVGREGATSLLRLVSVEALQ
jgi:hypothetical protein